MANPPPIPTDYSKPLPIGLIIALCIVGPICVVVTLFSVGARTSPVEDFVLRAATVLGATVFWPAILCGLFAIGQRFRNARSATVIVLVAWGFSIVGALPGLVRKIGTSSDSTGSIATADLEAKISALQERLATTDDPQAIRLLQSERRRTIEQLLPLLSSEKRVRMRVTLNVADPIAEAWQAHLADVAAFNAQVEWRMGRPASREGLARAIDAADRLTRGSAWILSSIRSVKSEASRIVEAEPMSVAARSSLLASIEQESAKRFYGWSATLLVHAELFDQHLRRLAMLEDHWGRWQVRDGVLRWDEKWLGSEYRSISAEIRRLTEREAEMRRQIPGGA